MIISSKSDLVWRNEAVVAHGVAGDAAVGPDHHVGHAGVGQGQTQPALGRELEHPRSRGFDKF